MTLGDAGLSNFATGLLSASGVILAISATIWIFIFDQRSRLEAEAIEKIQTNAKDLLDFLSSNRASPGNYIGSLQSYENFVLTLARVIDPNLPKGIPDFIYVAE